MKIMLPLDEDKKSVCVSFGRAPFFMLYDTDVSDFVILDNPGAQAEGGAGIKAAQFVADSGAEYLITVRCGENAAEVFKAADIQIFKSEFPEAVDNVNALKSDRLSPLTHFHAGYHGNR